jgi:hypothetical protein
MVMMSPDFFGRSGPNVKLQKRRTTFSTALQDGYMFIFYSTTEIIYPDAPASGRLKQDYFALFQIAYILSGNIEDVDLSGMENAFVTPVLRDLKLSFYY